MSIFSGWNAGDAELLKEALTGSPQGVMMLTVFVLILIALIYILVHIISHQVSNFYIRISQEEEEDDTADTAESDTEKAEREEDDPASRGGTVEK